MNHADWIRMPWGLGLAILFAASGCAGAQVIEPVVSRAEVVKIEAKDQSFTGFTSVAHVQIGASAKARKVREATYELLIGEARQPLASWQLQLDVDVPAEGGAIPLEVVSPYAGEGELQAILEREAPIPYIFRGTVKTDDGNAWEFSRASMVRAPRVPVAKVWHVEASAQGGEISLVFFLRLENQNPFDLQFEGLTFDLAVNGLSLAKEGKAGRKQSIPPSSTAQLEIPFLLSEANFPGVDQIIRSKRRMEYLIDGVIQLGIGHMPIELTGPIDL